MCWITGKQVHRQRGRVSVLKPKTRALRGKIDLWLVFMKHPSKNMKRRLLLLLLILTACAPTPTQNIEPAPLASPIPPATGTPFRPVLATKTSTPFAIPTATASPSHTPDPFLPYTISAMRTRSYGGGVLQIVEKLDEEKAFTRYKILYFSDGLRIYGFMNIPKGEGAFPVIIAIHGYSDPDNYQLMPYTTSYADDLSRAGYLVVHPNLRGYGESDSGENLYRAGFAVDILNLIAIIQENGIKVGATEKTIPSRIGIWSHSMGGEIALRVITVSDDIKATMLYAPMTGDVIKNAQIYQNIIAYPSLEEELNTPASLALAISPIYHYFHITSAIKLYHGTADPYIPVKYSQETCQILSNLGKEINCAFYEGAEHTFNSNYTAQFEKSYFYFFETHLQKP